ncbi:MAG: NAD(P)-dependent oxidoreductase [Bdellovibrionota bacterium]
MRKAKPFVVMTHPIHLRMVAQFLKPHARVFLAKNRSQLLASIPRADALLCYLSDEIDQRLLERATRLRVIGNFAVGVNNIDLRACATRGVRVVNTPRVLTEATAELALALLLAVARRVPEGEKLCRTGGFRGWDPGLLLGLQLRGRTAVLVGRGRIGRATGALFQRMGLKISWIVSTDSRTAIDRKLRRAQILSLHVPLTPTTRHWLDRRKLSLLPSDAIVLNTSRGAAIDEKALIEVLKQKKIFGAGLDVFEHEPAIPASLRRLSNVVLLPHVGSATLETRAEMAQIMIEGVLSILNGGRPWNEVSLS